MKLALRAGLAGLALFAASCGDLPQPTQGARGIIGDVNAVLFLSVLFVVVAVGIVVAAVALDRYIRTRHELSDASAAPEPEPEEVEEEEPVVAGIGQATGRVPRWLYAAYVVIPLWAMIYVVNAVAIQEEFGAPPTEPTPAPPTDVVTDHLTIVASNIEFDLEQMVLPANTDVTIEFVNEDSVPHNVAIYTDDSAAEEVFVGEVFTGPDTREYQFTAPDPGEYYFHCDVHPGMNGTVEFVVPEEAPPPGEEDTAEITAERIQFDTDELELPAETDVTIIFHNLDNVPHDIAIFTDETQAEVVFDGELVTGDTIEYEFTSPAAGEYYFHCTVHPSMNGTVRFT